MARPKGSKNKVTAAVKDMIEGALTELGGQEWLVKQARKSQRGAIAFMALVSKLVPRDLHVSGQLSLEQLIAGSYEQPADSGHVQDGSRPH